jgi:hypothetical protein
MVNQQGGCLCGKLRYAVHAQPVRVWVCHCRFCQRATGSAYLIDPHFEQGDFELLAGAPTTYAHRSAGSGRMLNIHFCDACGTKLYLTFEHHSRIGVFGGTFDAPGWFDASGENTAHIFLSSARPGIVVPAGVECFEERPVTPEGVPVPPSVHDKPYAIAPD